MTDSRLGADAHVTSARDASKDALRVDDAPARRYDVESTQRAVLNILEDYAVETGRLRDAQRALLNILDDNATEKQRLEKVQRELVRSEHAARQSLREKEVLLKEVHHRVKNNLQVISSLLNMQARRLKDPTARELFNESQNRVQSIALVHEKLYQSPDLSHVDFAEYVVALTSNLLHTHNAAERGITAQHELGNIRLSVDYAIPCGLIINELVTNCLKHAFPAGRTGSIRVLLRTCGPGMLELSVSDDGIGLPAGFDPRHTASLGLDLVCTFAEQLEAEVEVTGNPGTRFQFRFALAEGSSEIPR